MNVLKRFFGQRCRRYRNFQLVFTVLTLNFTLPALSYTFAPQVAIDQFLDINELLGGSPYLVAEAESHVWRYLGAANVMTLGLCCLLLQVNLRRFYAVLVPLTFMKGYATACWAVGWLLHPGYRFFLAAAVLDGVTCVAFVWFARRAKAEIDQHPDAPLVPPLCGEPGR